MMSSDSAKDRVLKVEFWAKTGLGDQPDFRFSAHMVNVSKDYFLKK